MLNRNWRRISGAAVLLALGACGGNSASDPAMAAGTTPRNLAARALAAVPAFGVTAANGVLTVSTGAGLVFKVNQSGGDISSITYNGGPELEGNSTKFSQVNSGIGATVDYVVNGTVAKITLTTASVVHYMLVRQSENNIYMGTYLPAATYGELRWITRLNESVLTQRPVPSDLTGSTGAIEAGDVYGMADGTTRSKYYGNDRAMDLTVRGLTGTGVGVYMAYGNRETSSGGPFFHDIQTQTAELYNYMFSGHNQTEALRAGFHGPYALMFNDGTTTPAVPDMSWMGNYGLSGWVGATGRGKVVLNGLANRKAGFNYTVGFANATAQYWQPASSSGSINLPGMKAGTYTMTVYKNELAVYTEQVTVTAGAPTTLNTRTINADPSDAVAVWRIGDWDGTPLELKNGPSFNTRHPSDIRNASWGPVTYAVGAASNTFPAAQWKTGINNPTTVTFNLTAAQVANHTVRIGITSAYGGGRPFIQVNNWTSTLPGMSAQPDSRSLTIGTYRGNNATFTYAVPASAFVAGSNTLTISVNSGSSGGGFLSPGYSYDTVDLL